MAESSEGLKTRRPPQWEGKSMGEGRVLEGIHQKLRYIFDEKAALP